MLAGCSWPMFGGDPAHTHFSLDTKINVSNVSGLTQRWATPTEGHVYSSPAVVNGVVYVGSLDGKVYALDTTTGAVRWSAGIGYEVLSSPAVVNGIVYAATYNESISDGAIFALMRRPARLAGA